MQGNPKKFTWENLEKMNLNELKGITQVNFDPATLIGNEDEEDRMYMQEYLKVSHSNRNPAKQMNDRKKFEEYGDLKRSNSGLNQNSSNIFNSPNLPPSPSKKQLSGKNNHIPGSYQ
jgi:hypothetical protein